MNDFQRADRVWVFYLPPLLVGCYLLAQCLRVILLRWNYPYELEWIEGGMFQAVTRIVDGFPLYASPTAEYVSPLYAPLYFYLSALSSLVMGHGLPALRLVSMLASFLTAGLVACSIWQLTRSRLSVLLGCCCWAALYSLSGTYYDLARVDALWTFFLTGALSSLVMYSRQFKSIWLFVCVFFLWLAVMTKQTTLVLLPFYLLALWCLSSLCLAVCSGLALVALLGVSVLFFQWQSDGFFYFYTMQMGRSHGFNPGLPFNFLLGDMLNGVPIYLLLSGVFIVLFGKNLRTVLAWLLIFLGYFFMGLLSRWYTGGWINVLIPLHQLMVIMAVSGFYLVLKRLYGQKGRLWKYGLMAMISVLFTLNIARGYIRADYMLPSAADRACGDAIVVAIAEVPDKTVCISRHPYLAALAGKQTCAHEAFVVDLLNGTDPRLSQKLREDANRQISNGGFGVMLLDNDGKFSGYDLPWRTLPYTATDIAVCPADVFFPKVSGQRPRHWLVYNGNTMVDRRESLLKKP